MRWRAKSNAPSRARTVSSTRGSTSSSKRDALAVDAKPRNPARAAVLLRARAGRASLDVADVQKLVAGSVAGLEPGAVAVVMSPAADPTETAAVPLAAVGPLRLTPGSRPLLVAVLATALLLLALLAGLLLMTARRLAALERGTSPKVPGNPAAG
jgi:type III secretory pathway lipoprotein EscJ